MDASSKRTLPPQKGNAENNIHATITALRAMTGQNSRARRRPRAKPPGAQCLEPWRAPDDESDRRNTPSAIPPIPMTALTSHARFGTPGVSCHPDGARRKPHTPCMMVGSRGHANSDDAKATRRGTAQMAVTGRKTVLAAPSPARAKLSRSMVSMPNSPPSG